MAPELQIGRVARETGLSIDTIRFYEREGLLRPQARSKGGFRLFSREDVRSLKFVRQAQELGFSLKEIRELLALRDGSMRACEHVRDLLEQKVWRVREKLEELRKLERELDGALATCRAELPRRFHHHEDRCPLLDEIRARSQ
jgi:DNA-binding transcriptional MerR regulator